MTREPLTWSAFDPSTGVQVRGNGHFLTRCEECSFLDGSIALSRGVVVWPRPSSSVKRLFSSIPHGRIWTRSQGRSLERNSELFPLQDDKHPLHPRNPLRKNHTEEHSASSLYECQTC